MSSPVFMRIIVLQTSGVFFAAASTVPVTFVLAWHIPWSFILYAILFMHTHYCPVVEQISRKLYILGGQCGRDLLR